MTDFVQFVVDTLDNHSWTYSPKPIIFHREDSERTDDSERTESVDLAENNALSVGKASDVRGPSGFDYAEENVEATVGVRVEGVHTDQRGNITDYADFKSLRDEVRSAILAERKHPISDADSDIHSLHVTDAEPRSANERDYYREDITVLFFGFEDV